jgi:phenylacetaldehyde dehydrogenase
MSVKHVEASSSVSSYLGRQHGLFIDGEVRPSAAGETTDVHNPATGLVIASVAEATKEDVDQAVKAADVSFRDGRWRQLRPADRERILWRLSDLIERDADFLAELETLEQGKSINIARGIEVGAGIEFIRYAAGLATKLSGRTLDLSIAVPPGTQYTGYTLRQPVGVVAAIAPWNFPFMIALWKVIPALVAGCSVVLKPSELTPLTALRFAELALEAGVPPGVLNVVTGMGPVAGHALVTAAEVAKISFTGSTATGKAIGKLAMDRLTRLSLELGGKNPAIVLKDADLDITIPGLMMGAYLNQGQVCASASRIYVEAPLFDRVAASLSDAVGGLSVGPGIDPASQINPLVSAAHRAKVQAFVDEAQSAGAQIAQGQDGPDAGGYYVRPTLIIDPDKALGLVRDEVFGPVLTLTRVKDAEEALQFANDSDYGLAASLWTRDLKSTMDLIPRIEAGTVWVNTHLFLDPNLPFGGVKQSGMGREFGHAWAEQFTEEKSVCIAH